MSMDVILFLGRDKDTNLSNSKIILYLCTIFYNFLVIIYTFSDSKTLFVTIVKPYKDSEKTDRRENTYVRTLISGCILFLISKNNVIKNLKVIYVVISITTKEHALLSKKRMTKVLKEEQGQKVVELP